MSAILSADDLNDFISPGVACIKPVETLPKQTAQEHNVYEVVKEGHLPEEQKPAEISLTDCLACSGCVTSAEAVLISLQSHAEVLNSLDGPGDRLFVASVSPQVRASIAATYNVSERQAGWMIDQLLSGPEGLASGGAHGHSFKWVVDTNIMREASLFLTAEELYQSFSGNPTQTTSAASITTPKLPILSSACPGWICYAEKTHPHILPHLSRLKSPQALTGTILKSVLSHHLSIPPDRIWHLAIMPCFDKKLEASRSELTHSSWHPQTPSSPSTNIRDVDCVITARELLLLAQTRHIAFPSLPTRPLTSRPPFPDPTIASFLFPPPTRHRPKPQKEAGTSGGYLHHLLATHLSQNPTAHLTTTRGRNPDVLDYAIRPSPTADSSSTPMFKAARYYGFRNIQNLVRKLKPPKPSRMPGAGRRVGGPKAATAGGGLEGLAYVEVMACPGGCTNGGGQIRVEDLPEQAGKVGQREWLGRVDEAYFSMEEEGEDGCDVGGEEEGMDLDCGEGEGEGVVGDEVNGISPSRIRGVLDYWAASTGIELDRLVKTTFRAVESDVGKAPGGGGAVEAIAGRAGGGW